MSSALIEKVNRAWPEHRFDNDGAIISGNLTSFWIDLIGVQIVASNNPSWHFTSGAFVVRYSLQSWLPWISFNFSFHQIFCFHIFLAYEWLWITMLNRSLIQNTWSIMTPHAHIAHLFGGWLHDLPFFWCIFFNIPCTFFLESPETLWYKSSACRNSGNLSSKVNLFGLKKEWIRIYFTVDVSSESTFYLSSFHDLTWFDVWKLRPSLQW